MINSEKVVKEFEGKTAKELIDAPVTALQGVSENDAEVLARLGIKTIKDMANFEWYRKALAIKELVEGE